MVGAAEIDVIESPFKIEAEDSNLVFLYTFTPPEGVITYTVMWDYHVGLVRLTPFFKSCKHKKVSLFPDFFFPD